MSNRLAQANSLYLQKHADNPIDWWAWTDEALETARRDDKPIFLSVGYSSCHWCTVMEGEAFSDPTIAAYMNGNFLPIKVDREERPDLDSIYMQAVQMMTGQGGWPLNIFLTPDDLVPFYGGTYFPIEPRYGRPGFLQVLQAIRNYYDTQKEKLHDVKSEILTALRDATTLQPSATIDPARLRSGLEYNTGVVASKSPGPSFPMIPYAEVALRATRFGIESPYNARSTSTQRGLDLALGGIFDHVAGGFHRYTVDPTWTVPHFEKMLYDNGQIVEYLANLWSAGVQEPAFERAISLTVRWLHREMTAPEGYFYAAQDADSFANLTEAEPEEGAFYVWDYAELERVLTAEELAELAQQFTVTSSGNFEGVNVLQRKHPGTLTATLETALGKLLQVRYGAAADDLPTFPPARNNREAKASNWAGRIPSVTDTKMIVAWNSLMISGLARSATVLGRSEYLELAAKAAQFILDHQWVENRFHRVNYEGKPAVLAQSEDYALFIKALLDLQQAYQSQTANQQAVVDSGAAAEVPVHYLETAVRVQAEFDEFLWSLDLGGYYNTDAGTDLLLRERSYVDNATPAANGIAAANLVRLALLTEDLSYLDRAEQTLQAFGSIMEESPQACPSLFSALDVFQNCLLIRTTAETIAQLALRYVPTAVYTLEAKLPAGAVGLVCQALSCKEAARSSEQLWQQVTTGQMRSGK
ncbi:thioredoxin domain-containing protein [Leptolyngbya sp. FACHB-36]|uniref:thioredoxin domain-containing protein n=1 Tax=Leptolyngbya sp. FACHB-36 TaxID=2692808 RepID=UPI0016814440|nr:thioredoxin domain-containing protein [Leptolyngbya sp. FACHB-36]MBD2021385.1 thioredoxin domain-containing protein [Leptolyngbya sp. FACHB-36]